MTSLQRKPSTSQLLKRPVAGSSRPPSRQAGVSRPATTQRAGEVSPSTASERSIQVVVRCRALSWQEIEGKEDECIHVDPSKGSLVSITAPEPKTALPALASPSVSRLTTQTSTKSYSFDHVFGPSADQGLLFNEIMAPILDEVLQGYNCTCLCYGQTGTGKTYTMEGDLNPSLGTYSPQAGIIPRTLHRLFELLNKNHEDFAVKVSFLELYNEELRDLNTPGEMSLPNGAHQPMSKLGPTARGSMAQQQQKEPELKIFDDNAKRSVIIQGAEETLITSAAEGIRVLTRGSHRRQAASTQVNEHSSRSHSIFTVTVHLKETSEVGDKGGSEDHLKIGKLHLVDLAGSENVGRSGALANRAREAGMINQSLLTLGRVINALVERQAHVPYRESKLTRILQDSLGGRTKTCIIATVSPAQVNYDETLSTLDYALRAKAIQNRPEANQRMTKAALLSQYSIEIERLRADLYATRTKTGIYVSQDSWDSMGEQHEETRKEAEMQRRHAAAYQMQLAAKSEEFEQCCRLLGVRESELKTLMDDLEKTSNSLAYRDAQLDVAEKVISDETLLRQAHDTKRREWKEWAKKAIDDTAGLREKIARKNAVELANQHKTADAQAAFGTASSALREQLSSFALQQQTFATALREGLNLGLSETSELGKAATSSTTDGKSRLEAAHSTMDTALRSLVDAGSILISSSDHVRTEFIDDARERADGFRDLCTHAVDSLLEQHQRMLETSFSAMERVLQEVEKGHAATVQRLQLNIAALQSRKEAEEARLKAEVERLEAQNTALEHLHASQTDSAASFRRDLLDALAVQVDGFLEKQGAARRTAFDSMREASAEAREDAQKAAAQSMADQAQLLANENDVLECVADSERTLEVAARETKEDLEVAAAHGREGVERVAASLNEEVDANERAYALYEDLAAAEETTYRETVEAKREAIELALESFVSEAAATFDGVSTAMTSVSEAAQRSAEDTMTLLDEHLTANESSLGLFATQLESIQAPQLAVDVSTGQTPRQRDWPTMLDEDELEGGRELLLQRLRGTIHTPIALPAPEPSSIAVPPTVKLEIPLGAATVKAPVVRRSALGDKVANQATVAPAPQLTGRRALQDSVNRA